MFSRLDVKQNRVRRGRETVPEKEQTGRWSIAGAIPLSCEFYINLFLFFHCCFIMKKWNTGYGI